MSIEIAITDGALGPGSVTDPCGAGAVAMFEGVVREREGDTVISALDYRTYDPMAERMLRRLAEDVARRFGLVHVRVEHSRGRVAVGLCSFRLVIAAEHRKEALAAMDEFIDRLKRDVPIWKSPVG